MNRIRIIAAITGLFCMSVSAADGTNVAAKKDVTNEQGGYEKISTGTRQFEFDTDRGIGWIKVLVEAETLGEPGAEVAEVFFPPGYVGQPHPHGIEIIYVLEGRLDHIVNGDSHILEPGMVGVIKAPDTTVHKALSEDGVRVLILWPIGDEVKNLEGMREKEL